jgi:hypothetical protein
MSALTSAAAEVTAVDETEAKRLAAVVVNKDDITFIVSELEIAKELAEKVLRECGGSLEDAIAELVHFYDEHGRKYDAEGNIVTRHIYEIPSPFYSTEWQENEEPKDKEEPKKEAVQAVAAEAPKEAPTPKSKGKSKKGK